MDCARRAEGYESDEPVKPEPIFMVNPEVVWSSDEMSSYEEGCLSIPEYYAEIERPAEVIVKYVGYNGQEEELKADGLLATCVQHEIDHLDGILFIDYLPNCSAFSCTGDLRNSIPRPALRGGWL